MMLVLGALLFHDLDLKLFKSDIVLGGQAKE